MHHTIRDIGLIALGLLFRNRVGRRCRSSLHVVGHLAIGSVTEKARRHRLLPVVASLFDDEDVEPAWHDEADYTPHEEEVADDEAHDVERVIVECLKTGIGEAENDGKDWTGEVAQERRPEEW